MQLRAVVLVPCLLAVACAGSVVTTGSGGQGGESGGGGASMAGSGGTAGAGGLTGAGGSATRPGCAPIPTAPEYDCQMHQHIDSDCAPWTPDGTGEPNISLGYPQNCNVRLPRPDAFSGGCGPQQCQCSQFPDSTGTFVPGWVCPL